MVELQSEILKSILKSSLLLTFKNNLLVLAEIQNPNLDKSLDPGDIEQDSYFTFKTSRYKTGS